MPDKKCEQCYFSSKGKALSHYKRVFDFITGIFGTSHALACVAQMYKPCREVRNNERCVEYFRVKPNCESIICWSWTSNAYALEKGLNAR